MAKLVMDPATRGEDGAAARALAQRLNRFENKNTWWRHDRNGTMAEFDRGFEEALARVRGQLGATHALVIDGKEEGRDTFDTFSPADTSLLVGRWPKGTREDARRAIRAAKAGFRDWSSRPWQERAGIIEAAADLFTRHYYDLCAVMSIEAGKTRYEASIDVDEAIDFLRYYALTMREMDGFDVEMGKPVPTEHCRSVRKPWGVFAVVCPFNFPIAITTGMTSAALITGNTAVLKPSAKGLLSGWWVYRLLREAGVPGTALQFVVGGDHGASEELLESPEVDGLVFTGSKPIGMKAWQAAARNGRPKPVIAEMGGKNAIIVSEHADLDKAVQGVFRSAFGFSGQKCSACSRVYVHRKVAEEFTERLVKLTQAARVGLPWQKASYMGPVIEPGRIRLLEELVAEAGKAGGKVLAGGARVAQDADGKPLQGHYMAPTLVAGLPKDHRVFREEFFMPFAAIAVVDSFDEALREANAVEYGLTAGCFTEDEAEQRRFFAEVEAGVTYMNRASGGSTAAVVNGQAFGGWKNSGSTGNGAGGRYYLLQFTREQAQTVVLDAGRPA
jgi:1-pyrroline-5-carboxylate dehydrogenase